MTPRNSNASVRISRLALPRSIVFAVVAALLVFSVKAQNLTMDADHPYVGMWITADGVIRQELLPNGRYQEARGTRERAYEGRYEVTGNQIEYWDDTGFTADGYFAEDVLYHGGMVMHRRTD
jgi:hypothetical protein